MFTRLSRLFAKPKTLGKNPALLTHTNSILENLTIYDKDLKSFLTWGSLAWWQPGGISYQFNDRRARISDTLHLILQEAYNNFKVTDNKTDRQNTIDQTIKKVCMKRANARFTLFRTASSQKLQAYSHTLPQIN